MKSYPSSTFVHPANSNGVFSLSGSSGSVGSVGSSGFYDSAQSIVRLIHLAVPSTLNSIPLASVSLEANVSSNGVSLPSPVIVLFKIFDFSKNNKRITTKTFLLCLPFIIVAVNNFPYASYLQGTLVLECKPHELILYLIMSLLICTFEELIFRKLLFQYILKQTKTKKRYSYSIILSSLIFALLHLTNLLGGASFLPTLLQVGYSFLIGMMLCLTLLVSNNILLCIIIHSIYNILGLSINYFTTSYHIDVLTIIITVCVSIFAFIWGVFLLRKYTQDNQ